jgi:hypothetical protein
VAEEGGAASTTTSVVVGWALDGFPLVAERPWPGPDQLDECNGR